MAAAIVYCLDSLNLFRRFLASTFNLVIFDQGIRGYAHLTAPVSIARGISDGQGAHLELLADHWSPVLALLAPLYWIHDGPATLLVAQGVLFALAIPPLWIYTRRRLGPRTRGPRTSSAWPTPCRCRSWKRSSSTSTRSPSSPCSPR